MVISNVANGLIAAGRRDAVNGDQLHSMQQQINGRMDGLEQRIDGQPQARATAAASTPSPSTEETAPAPETGGSPQIASTGEGDKPAPQPKPKQDDTPKPQVDTADLEKMLARANEYTDGAISAFERRLDKMDKRFNRMAAMSSAQSAMAMNTAGLATYNRLGAGVGSEGESAMAVGYQRVLNEKGSATFSSMVRSPTAVNAAWASAWASAGKPCGPGVVRVMNPAAPGSLPRDGNVQMGTRNYQLSHVLYLAGALSLLHLEPGPVDADERAVHRRSSAGAVVPVADAGRAAAARTPESRGAAHRRCLQRGDPSHRAGTPRGQHAGAPFTTPEEVRASTLRTMRVRQVMDSEVVWRLKADMLADIADYITARWVRPVRLPTDSRSI